MKILQCSDAHHDWRTSGVERAPDVEEAFEQTVRVAIDEGVDLYLFTGDLCDPDDGQRALRAVACALDVATLLADRKIPSWWVRGNHDVIETGDDCSTLTPLSRIRADVRVFDQPARVMLPGRPRVGRGAPAFAVLLPYPSATRPYDPAAFVRKARGELPTSQVLVAAHLQVDGATPGDETTEMARGRDVFFPFEECAPGWLLVNGHYHEGQTFERAGRKLHVPGSMVRLNHGEERNRPRFLIWEI